MAILPIQTGNPGLAPAYSAASATGDQFANSGAHFLVITGATGRTLIVDSPHAGLDDYEHVIAGGTFISPRFDPLRWNDEATGRLSFHFSNHVGVGVAAVQLAVIGFDPDGPIVPSLV